MKTKIQNGEAKETTTEEIKHGSKERKVIVRRREKRVCMRR
jgi:hypothetical protein